MSYNNTREDILAEIINAYRWVIAERYQYDNLVISYDLPSSFNADRVAVLRTYFLEQLYPPPEKRAEIEQAFNHLDDYIKSPKKLLRILMDSGSLLFKHGRHLPRILQAGIKALQSFIAASKFEKSLVDAAMTIPLQPPYDKDSINQMLATLSEADIERFIVNNEALFSTLHDRELVGKIIEIVSQLLVKMRQHDDLYSAEEIRGLEIGLEIIQEGNALFAQLSEEEQKRIFELIIKVERDALEDVFRN
jgi:hypothetical protein